MAEAEVTNSQNQPATTTQAQTQTQVPLSDRRPATRRVSPLPFSLYGNNKKGSLQSFFALPRMKRDMPPWLLPFFSMRVQLSAAFSLILILIVAITSTLATQPMSSVLMGFLTVMLVVVGIAGAFFLITLLLRPLWRVTDAAQAIAVGDLEQRSRLPLRLPPQDEVDRLAGSLNEMVSHLMIAEELQQSSEARFRRFFSDASHQLRTPLTSLRGFTEIMLRGAKDEPETAQRVLLLMKTEADRMTHLVNDLLTLARLDDVQPLKREYVDLIELGMQEIQKTREQIKDGRSIAFVLGTEERLGIRADKDRIKQLLFILLDNALKHGRQGPDAAVTLHLSKRGEWAIVRVIDNGNGIPAEELDHVFDSFYRGHRRLNGSDASAGTATGLGLTIATAIARAHGGSIVAQSEPEVGTEFTVTLPCIG